MWTSILVLGPFKKYITFKKYEKVVLNFLLDYLIIFQVQYIKQTSRVTNLLLYWDRVGHNPQTK